MAREALAAHPVGLEHRAVGLGLVPGQPRQQSGSEVEADGCVVVHDADDAAVRVEYPGVGVGRIAFGRDALVPVVVRVGRVLELDRLQPGVLARRLVEVAVNADEAVRVAAHATSHRSHRSRPPV